MDLVLERVTRHGDLEFGVKYEEFIYSRHLLSTKDVPGTELG